MEPAILVVGGAGYIGSHMTKCLRQTGYKVVVLDDLSSGFRGALLGAELIEGSIADRDLLTHLFSLRRFAAVMHFASFIRVDESVVAPDKYYKNNLAATLTLLDVMRSAGVMHFIFSSTAAVYGHPAYVPIDEEHPAQPISPYGRSKWMLEQILEDYDLAFGLKSVCLRYFNAAGADPGGELGECHESETHLIPLVLQTAAGRRGAISVFGTDYDTHDGTCVRDYIHVLDICSAHLLALNHLLAGRESMRLNLGNGVGFSVKDVIETAKFVTGRDIPVRYEARRAGDPARLVANAARARETLGWMPERNSLETIIADAWGWEQQHPWFRE